MVLLHQFYNRLSIPLSLNEKTSNRSYVIVNIYTSCGQRSIYKIFQTIGPYTEPCSTPFTSMVILLDSKVLLMQDILGNVCIVLITALTTCTVYFPSSAILPTRLAFCSTGFDQSLVHFSQNTEQTDKSKGRETQRRLSVW